MLNISQTQQLRNAVKLVSSVLDAGAPASGFATVPGKTLLERVYRVLENGEFHSLGEIAFRTGGTTASVSARIRDLRKTRYGMHYITRRRLPAGGFEYRLVA